MQTALFTELLAKEMTRREFLLHLGVLVLTVTGVSGLLKIFSDPNLGLSKSKTGFGSGPYGG